MSTLQIYCYPDSNSFKKYATFELSDSYVYRQLK